MCDVIETLVLLCHCGRINNTGKELTSAVPLLSCVCAYLKLTVATAGCLNCLCFLNMACPLVSLLSFYVGRQLMVRSP